MIRKSTSFSIFILLLVIALGFTLPPKRKIVWPKKIYDFGNNLSSEEKKELGRVLFYDPLLSSNGSISCSSCHLSYTAFAHTDHPTSHGVNDAVGTRNAPALFNLAWKKNFMWDGAVHHLDAQALAPIENKLEMNESLPNVIEKLNARKFYRELFYQAWGDSLATGERMLKSISQFLISLESTNSKYDQMLEGTLKFTAQEQQGYLLFQKFCNACHTEPLFTSNQFANNGIEPRFTSDLGRENITGRKEDRYLFMVPSLRNIEFSYPYMHDGQMKTLQDVLNHYSNGSNFEGSTSLPLNQKMHLSSNEKQDLIAFLLTLTDQQFLTRTDYQFPKKLQNEILQRATQ
ncbi:MAG: cytochrome-c peroxidase [Bacteroidota bacterium]|jgi:cytochrome c peroxidase